MTTSFVAGATGYVGAEVVRLLCEAGEDVVAHIRPGSSKREACAEQFEELGARVSYTPWEEEAMTDALAELAPDVVYCLIGTTRARKKRADDPEEETYGAVDYGLTALLVRACVEAEIEPRFVFISAIGVGPDARTAYMRARWNAENYIRASGLPYTIARPSFISGPDRRETRIGERFGAVAADVALFLAGLVGFVGLRDRYQSMTATEMARALIALADDEEAEDAVVETRELRRLGDNA